MHPIPRLEKGCNKNIQLCACRVRDEISDLSEKYSAALSEHETSNAVVQVALFYLWLLHVSYKYFGKYVCAARHASKYMHLNSASLALLQKVVVVDELGLGMPALTSPEKVVISGICAGAPLYNAGSPLVII